MAKRISRPHSNLWQQSSPDTPALSPLSSGCQVDLAVIGGGFTGCSAALTAARQGASVAVFEARHIGFGGSGRNVGLVNAGLWLPPEAVVGALGDAVGHELLTALSDGPQMVFDLIARESIDCEATRNGTLHLAHAPVGLRDLQDRAQQGQAIGAPVRLLEATDTARRTGSTAFHGALFDPRAGTIQPLSYCRGLARAAINHGAKVYEHSPVTDLHRDGDSWRLSCNGYDIRAGAVLVATNAYMTGLTGVSAPAYVPVGYSQFATAPLAPDLRAQILTDGEGCWDTAMVMSSFRMDQAGRLILGCIGTYDQPAGALHLTWARRHLRRLFPALTGIAFEHGWSGRIAMTSDHIPKIVAFGPKALSIFGYSGRGIAPGTVFGDAAARALLSDDPTHLTLPPVPAHSERFTRSRGAFYEFGASMAHLI